MLLFKVQKRLGIRRAEAINTLVLIAHHEQIIVPGSQQRNDCMLNLGCILCLIHANILINILKMLQNLRHLP